MKNSISILLFLISFSAKSQKMTFQSDSIKLDLKKIRPYGDTLNLYLNNDAFVDKIIKYVYKYKVPIPINESNQILAIYINDRNKTFRYYEQNNGILWKINNEVIQLKNGSFLVINKGSGQDSNRYFCYFEFDSETNNWLLAKTEIYLAFYKETEDIESLKLIKTREFARSEKIYFKDAKFPKLFETELNDIDYSSYYTKVKVSKSIIYSKINVPTKKYLLKGDQIKVVKEKGNFLQFYYYGKKTIEGWIKKSDVE
jgi:hypothetical protein